MKITPLACLTLVLASANIALAQQPSGSRTERRTSTTTTTPVAAHHQDSTVPIVTPQTVTPEMWIYSNEMHRHDDPAQAVRRKAELRADQRMQRIAAMKWFGFSNARPQASTTPMMGAYSPRWVGNSYEPYDWSGIANPSTAVYIDQYELRR